MAGYYGTLQNGSDILAHYGVKGMKWGIRRGRVRKSKPKKMSNKELRRKLDNELKGMTDQQLQQRLNRMRNEDAFRQMSGVRTRSFRQNVSNKIQDGAAQGIANIPSKAVAVGAGMAVTYGAMKLQSRAEGARRFRNTMKVVADIGLQSAKQKK